MGRGGKDNQKINLGKLETVTNTKPDPTPDIRGMKYPEQFEQVPERELRKEYTRLRDIAQKRIKRLATSDYSESQTYLKWKEGVPKLRDLKPDDLPYAMAELKSFVDNPLSTLKGQRSKDVKIKEALGEHYTDLKDLIENPKTREKFFRFMDRLKQYNLEKLYGSDRVVQLFMVVENKGINSDVLSKTRKDFAFFIDNLENLNQIEFTRKKTGVEKAKRAIGDMINHGEDYRPFTLLDRLPKTRKQQRRKKRNK